jgi:hypothetical protein
VGPARGDRGGGRCARAEAEMPHAVNGTTLTTDSTTNATSLGGDPSSRALSAAVTSLGKKPGDLEIAEAYDASGASP